MTGVQTCALPICIVMRNSQFGYPLDAKTLDDALNGRIAPLTFDYAKAEARLAA